MVEWSINAGTLQGSREYQQDHVAYLVSDGGDCVVAILCDGIGGGAHGGLASKIVIDKCIKALQPGLEELSEDSAPLPQLLRQVTDEANLAIELRAASDPQTSGMGTTLIIAVLWEDRLFWCSVGDSHLSLHRDGKLHRLNADHSLASGLNDMVKIGAINPAVASSSRKNSVLTSAISGSVLKEIDCPEEGYPVGREDVVLLFSDGLETLSNDQIEKICETSARPAQLCAGLLDAVEAERAENQDNVTVVAAMVPRRIV